MAEYDGAIGASTLSSEIGADVRHSHSSSHSMSTFSPPILLGASVTNCEESLRQLHQTRIVASPVSHTTLSINGAHTGPSNNTKYGGDSNNNPGYDWTKTGCVVVGVTALLGFIVALSKVYQQTHRAQVQTGLATLSTPFEPAAIRAGTKEYLPRPAAEARIADYLSSCDEGILAVYGRKGIGKSTVLEHCLAHLPNGTRRRGVLVVEVEAADVIDVHRLLAKSLGADVTRISGVFADYVTEVCTAFCEKYGYLPTIVITTSLTKESLEGIASVPDLGRQITEALRVYMHRQCAMTIADVSTTGVAHSLLRETRVNFLHVPELTSEQTQRFMGDHLKRLVSSGITLTRIMKEIGGCPQSLQMLLIDSNNPRLSIREAHTIARRDVAKYLEAHPRHRPAVRVLLKAPYDQGLSLDAFSK